MEDKVNPVRNVDGTIIGSVNLRNGMGFYIDDSKYLGGHDLARQYAHAILELIGDPVPGKGDDTYIAVVKAEYGYFLGGRITGAMSGPMSADTAIESLQEDASSEEFHIFRRVATVGPIPQPERKVTRYE